VNEILAFVLQHASWLTAIGGLLAIAAALGSSWSERREQRTGNPLFATRLSWHTKPRRFVPAWSAVAFVGGVTAVLGGLVADSINDARSKRDRDYERGANSFAYLHMENLGTKDAHASIRHCGPNPARDVAFDIVRQSQMDASLSFQARNDRILKARLGDIYAGRDISLDRFDFPDWSAPQPDIETYSIFIRDESGAYVQTLYIVKHEEKWSQFYVLRNYVQGDRFSVYQAYVDPALPNDGMPETVRHGAQALQRV
jgi:hypothetical protein